MNEEMRQIRFKYYGLADKRTLIEKIIELEDEVIRLQTMTLDDYVLRMIISKK